MSEIRVNTIVSETGTGNVAFSKGINVTGVTTSTSFKGDIVGDVTGDVTGNCSGTSGSATGTAGGLTGTPDITVNNITGVAATFTGAVSYEDVTNIDSLGIVTARGGLEVGAAGVGGTVSALGHVEFVGVTTIGLGLTLADNVHARFGNAGDLKIYHDSGGQSRIEESGSSVLKIMGSDLRLSNTSNSADYVQANDGAAVNIYFNGSKKLETTNTGVEVTGTATATEFVGGGSGLTGLSIPAGFTELDAALFN